LQIQTLTLTNNAVLLSQWTFWWRWISLEGVLEVFVSDLCVCVFLAYCRHSVYTCRISWQIYLNCLQSKVTLIQVNPWSLMWETCSPVQTQRMDPETRGVQWKRDFNGGFARSHAWKTDMPKAVTSIIQSSSKFLPWFLIGWIQRVYSLQPPPHTQPKFPIGLFKICLSWDWSNFKAGFKCHPPLFVVGRAPCDMCCLAPTEFLPLSSFCCGLPLLV
jgi:hypothetical protein